MWLPQLMLVVSVCGARQLDPTPAYSNERFVTDLVNAHNDIRSEFGKQAANMLHMSWDVGLAKLAQAWTINCKKVPNPHLNKESIYPRFKQIGENLYMGPSIDIFKIVTNWGLEGNFYDLKNNSCQPGKDCSHFTQIVWANTYKVGCGAAYCAHKVAYVVSCTYGPRGNLLGQVPFILGVKCSKCGGEKCNVASCGNPSRDENYGDYNYCPPFATIDCYRLSKGNVRVNNEKVRVGLECADCVYTDGDSESGTEDHFAYVDYTGNFSVTHSSAVRRTAYSYFMYSLMCIIWK
uniref:GLIPR1-like protein 1 n=1 Tax=Xenopus tropicalis TaxID=8364 RepID=A0A803J6G9_XENTR